MRKYEIYGVGDNVIDLPPNGKFPLPPRSSRLDRIGGGIVKKLRVEGD
jgi:hypothetical protein